MRASLANLRDLVKTQLWPVPAAAVVAALLLGWGIPRLDSTVDRHLSSTASTWLFSGDADAARSLLGVIGTSMITVTSLTFSLTVVTLQLASSQFSPRLLRTFTSDQFVQATLALFLATFTYALTVLRGVRSGTVDGAQGEFVPKIAVTTAFALTIASVLGLVLFLAHLSEQIRVETMLRNVHREGTRTMNTVLPAREGRPARRTGRGSRSASSHTEDRTTTETADATAEPRPPADAVAVVARGDGFLTFVDEDDLLEVATDEDASLFLDVHPGSFLVEGTPLGRVGAFGAGPLDEEATERISDRVAACIHVGFERTAAQDVGFGLRQLADVANKALSPGINDPTTAIHALGHISAFLCELSDHALGAAVLRDDHDRVRVVMHRPDFAAYVDLGISQPRRYGAGDPQVLEKILQVLLDLSCRVRPDQVPVVRAQLERLRSTVESQSFDAAERAGLALLGEQVEENLRGRTTARPETAAPGVPS